MADRQNRRDASRTSAPKATEVRARGEPAFDLWLRRGLHQLYDEVAKEPIPDELLRLIREDEGK